MSKRKLNGLYSRRNKIKLVPGGASYFQLLERLIQQAKISIYVHVYIFDDDRTGIHIANALQNAAERGVQVYVLADGYASQWMSRSVIRQMKHKGVHFRFFEPLLRSSHFYFGRRMHYKIVVVDGFYALVGGINLADRYNEIDNIPAWLDYALYVEGEVATQLCSLCREQWDPGPARSCLPANEGQFSVFTADEHFSSVRIRRNDWVKGKHEIWKTYFNFFNQARESITIMCSYFLPGRVLRKRLSIAAKRGVKVRIILAGPSDVALAKYAERYLYNWMLRNNIEIYEYQPTVLHAKIAVIDGRWMTIGSYNINNISAYASLELNLDVRNRKFCSTVQGELDRIIEKDCLQITGKNIYPKPTLVRRFLEKSSYEFIRTVLNLSTFYFKHE